VLELSNFKLFIQFFSFPFLFSLYFCLVSVVSLFFSSSQLLFQPFSRYEYCALVYLVFFFCQNKKQTVNCKKISDQNRTKMNKKQMKNKEKFEQKREKERIYSTFFAPYEPAAVYLINFINKNTTEAELTNYKTMIEESSWCICDTEADRNTNKGALIQLMIPNKDEHSFMVFLIEMRQIEEFPKPQFVIVKQMLHHLFTSSIIMFIWGFLKAELQYFVNHSMIPFQTKVQGVNLQAIFKKWFDYALGINPSPIKQFSQSIVAQLVSHDSLNQMKKTKNNEWSLQDAVIYTLHKYLSKKKHGKIGHKG